MQQVLCGLPYVIISKVHAYFDQPLRGHG